MQPILGFSAFVLIIFMVIIRVRLMSKGGTKALHFGNQNKSDFILPPVMLFYLYVISANAFHLPSFAMGGFFKSVTVGWVGIGFCALG
jgi:hypothetical protein